MSRLPGPPPTAAVGRAASAVTSAYLCVYSDHRKLGAELNLFSINDMGGAGLVFWHPKVSRRHATLCLDVAL